MRSVIANLGFVMQFAGIFLLFPVVAAFSLQETEALISFLVTGFSFFLIGFFMNTLSQRNHMGYRAACMLLAASFLMFSLVGAIPYLWLNPFGQADLGNLIVNSIFESASGFTTTGLSLITDLDALPRSLAFYRSLTELIGGIGVVFLLLGFFYKGSTIQNISRLIGLIDVSKNIRRSFLSVVLVYLFYLAILAGGLLLLSYANLIDSVSTIISGLMTGGLAPVNDFAKFLTFPGILVIVLSMGLGCTSFTIHYRLYSGRFREALKKELLLFLGIIVAATGAIALFSSHTLLETFFHVVSAASTTGFSTWDFAALDAGVKLLFILIMFVGGMSISTAGGIKVLRLAVFLKSIPAVIRGISAGAARGVRFDGKEYAPADVSTNMLFIILSIVVVFAAAAALADAGYPFSDALFEATSAFATVGLSTGITSVTLAILLKAVLILLMLIGRIEIIPVLIALVGVEEALVSGHEEEGRPLARLNQP